MVVVSVSVVRVYFACVDIDSFDDVASLFFSWFFCWSLCTRFYVPQICTRRARKFTRNVCGCVCVRLCRNCKQNGLNENWRNKEAVKMNYLFGRRDPRDRRVHNWQPTLHLNNSQTLCELLNWIWKQFMKYYAIDRFNESKTLFGSVYDVSSFVAGQTISVCKMNELNVMCIPS